MTYNYKPKTEYYNANREKKLKYAREYYRAHRDIINSKNKERGERYGVKGLRKKWEKSYYARNKEKVLLETSIYRQETRKKIIVLLGGKCVVCGESNPRYLQTDRIKGGRHSTSVRWIAQHIKEFQLLCANHHHEKTNYGEVLYNNQVFEWGTKGRLLSLDTPR